MALGKTCWPRTPRRWRPWNGGSRAAPAKSENVVTPSPQPGARPSLLGIDTAKTEGALADADLALADMDRVIDLGPEDALARRQFGQMCTLSALLAIASGGDAERAEAYLRRGIDRKAVDTDALENLRGHLPDALIDAAIRYATG